MKKFPLFLLISALLVLGSSCRKVKDYFRDPATDDLKETIRSAEITGYAALLSMAVMNGQSFSHVTSQRSNQGYPCTSLTVADLENEPELDWARGQAGTITIIGLWADENTAILNLLFTDYNTVAGTIDLLGIETIPVIKDGNHIQLAMADMDISLNPDQQSLLQINLNTLEIESELLRLDQTLPTDVYIAVTQNAYFVDVDNHGTINEPVDDSYTITGGGQLVEVTGHSEEIVQLAMINACLDPSCPSNPIEGMALIQVTGVENAGFPELGTAVLEFSDNCNAKAYVFAATGMYVTSNGSNIDFDLQER